MGVDNTRLCYRGKERFPHGTVEKIISNCQSSNLKNNLQKVGDTNSQIHKYVQQHCITSSVILYNRINHFLQSYHNNNFFRF